MNARQPLLFDGAFGTYYYKLNPGLSPCELANLETPELVRRIHREYIDAGAQALKTNTYGANPFALGDWETVSRVVERGYVLAKEAAGDQAFVYADVGYCGEDEEQPEVYRRLAARFISLGADRFLFETFGELEPLLPALREIREQRPNAHVIVSFAVSQDGFTAKGQEYRTLIRQAAQNPCIDWVGMNCVCGPAHMIRLMEALPLETMSFCSMPNAGYPASIGGRTVFRDNAGYFAEKLKRIADMGAAAVGGCCGTTPEHIRQAAQALSGAGTAPAVRRTATSIPEEPPRVPPFWEKAEGKKAVLIELDPPADSSIAPLLEQAKQLKQSGADVLTLGDSPLARTRADSIITAARVKRETGLETLPHISCRDRNHIGMKGALLGAHMEGLRHLLAVTGDPAPHTGNARQTGVFSFHSIALLQFIKSLNEDVFASSPLYPGAALNLNISRFEPELRRALEKEKAGAVFFLTQPVFTREALERLCTARKALKGKLYAGILPVAGYKNALFLHNEVSGIEIPPELLARLEHADRNRAAELSYCFSLEIARQAAPYCDGFYLMPPLKRLDVICRLIPELKRL